MFILRLLPPFSSVGDTSIGRVSHASYAVDSVVQQFMSTGSAAAYEMLLMRGCLPLKVGYLRHVLQVEGWNAVYELMSG